jgi:hypothetical protein
VSVLVKRAPNTTDRLTVPTAKKAPARHVRSTVLVSSLAAIREHGLFARYEPLVPAAVKDELFHAVVGSWMPIELANAHYAACNRLELSVDDQFAIGRTAGRKLSEIWLATAARIARAMGATPWTLLRQTPRFWERGFDGGVVSVQQISAREVRAEVSGVELLQYGYFRNALRGVLWTVADLFSLQAHVYETTWRSFDEIAGYRIHWV